jgi:hypothetical protein
MPTYPSSQRDSSDEAGEEAANHEEEPQQFWMSVEGWLRQRVSEGKDNYCTDVVFVPAVPSEKVHIYCLFQEYINAMSMFAHIQCRNLNCVDLYCPEQ